MSAYVELGTPMTDRGCLLAALADVGFPAKKVEVHANPVLLVGYEGIARGQVAHIVIRRKHVGRISNDIGFQRIATGYRVHISDIDQNRYGIVWLQRLQMRYMLHFNAQEQAMASRPQEAHGRDEERRQVVEAQRREVREKARRLGYRVEETRQGEAVRLVLTKSSH